MMYDADFDVPIESKFWGLANIAIEQGICMSIEFHKDARNFTVVQIKMYIIDKLPIENIFNSFAFEHDASPLYYKAKKFLKELNK